MSKYQSVINLDDKNNTSTMIFEKVKEKSLVFDVGCASGYLAEVLKNEKKCKVIGLEIDEDDAAKAEEFCEFVLREDIEGNDWEGRLKNYHFDHVIFADVLEHLKDPEKTLIRIKKFLKPNGSVLVSVPNISHVSVRLELLDGKFVPETTGILDNTHLKYFTKETFTKIANDAGYFISDSYQSSFDFPEDKIREMLVKMGLKPESDGIKRLSTDEAIAYQYFFELKLGKKPSTNYKVEEKKPIYFVKDYLKSIDEDHKKFKEIESRARLELESENKTLKENIRLLEEKVGVSISAKIKNKLKKILKRK